MPRALYEESAVKRPEGRPETVAAFVRTIFYQPDHATAMTHLKQVAGMLRPRFPAAAELLEDAAEDILAHMPSPRTTGAGCTRLTPSSDCT
jgi:transposase-like protein